MYRDDLAALLNAIEGSIILIHNNERAHAEVDFNQDAVNYAKCR